MSEERCETCRYWHPLKNNLGHCRRYPPQLNPPAVLEAARPYPHGVDEFPAYEAAYHEELCWSFPVVYAATWCGEYAPAPKPDRAGSPSV